jgi:hypothetical protein
VPPESEREKEPLSLNNYPAKGHLNIPCFLLSPLLPSSECDTAVVCVCAACGERKSAPPLYTFSKTTSDAERPSLSLLAGQAKCMAESAPAAKREVNKCHVAI